MLLGSKEQQQALSPSVRIQDIVVVAPTYLYYTQHSGEVNQSQAEANVAGQHEISTSLSPLIGDRYTSAEKTADTRFYRPVEEVDSASAAIPRIMATIQPLVDRACLEHEKVIDPNTITRLVTNEFMFFTKVPFELAEFDDLQAKIFELAEKTPKNIHLILSSFAVFTPGSVTEETKKIMNVVVYIECGPEPILNFCAKQSSSFLDPKYPYFLSGKERMFDYINSINDRLAFAGVMIDGKEYPYSYNNVFYVKQKAAFPFTLA